MGMARHLLSFSIGIVKENFKNERKNDLILKKYVEPTSKITRIAFEHGAHLVSVSNVIHE